MRAGVSHHPCVFSCNEMRIEEQNVSQPEVVQRDVCKMNSVSQSVKCVCK